MPRVAIQPALLQWACQRSGLDNLLLQQRFPKLAEWESGERQPTLKQLEKFAKATFTPVGFFFLTEPPEEQIPIPDFRTMRGRVVTRPKANLLDTIYLCQQRQDWYRQHARSNGFKPIAFVGAVTRKTAVTEAAAKMQNVLGFDLAHRAKFSTWEETLAEFIKRVEQVGVLVMRSGIVANNTRRKLDPEEFRGFALADELAPLIFINGADTKSAQMFTLAHELAHLWLGQSALSSVEIVDREEHAVEQWCDAVAAEFLVPMTDLTGAVETLTVDDELIKALARKYKVSTLVILRRLRDGEFLGWNEYRQRYAHELQRLLNMKKSGGSGGSYYPTQTARVGKRFATTIIESALEGQTLYRDAMRMLGVVKQSTFNELGRSLGIAM